MKVNKAQPCGSDDDRNSKSAGISQLFCTLIISPTMIDFHSKGLSPPPCKTSDLRAFTCSLLRKENSCSDYIIHKLNKYFMLSPTLFHVLTFRTSYTLSM